MLFNIRLLFRIKFSPHATSCSPFGCIAGWISLYATPLPIHLPLCCSTTKACCIRTEQRKLDRRAKGRHRCLIVLRRGTHPPSLVAVQTVALGHEEIGPLRGPPDCCCLNNAAAK